MEILKIKNLSFTYPNQKTKAVDNLSLTIKEGDFIVVCGESGCGKTTLLKLIKKELAPMGDKTGEILYYDTSIEDLSDRESASEIGYVMQNPKMQIVTDKVWHELAFGLENIGVPSGDIRRRVGEMASFFGITDWFRKNTSELSGGQQQLLNLAAIMVMQPRLLILDEPTAQLDPIAASEFIAALQKINNELGLTIILVEHRLEEVFPIASYVAVMESGRLEVYDAPKNVGTKLKNHNMHLGLPSSVRIFNMLESSGDCPLTVKDGRDFLTKHFKNSINKIDLPENNEKKETVISVKDIWFRYDKNSEDILRGISFDAYRGEVLSILGGNGTGKTTLLSVLSSQNKAYRGKVTINNKRIEKYGLDLYKNNLAYLPQNPQNVFLQPTVLEDYEEVINVMGYNEVEKATLLTDICEKLKIGHIMEKHPYDLSGGEQQKAALGKILLLKPKILLLDEPTKGIDPLSKHIFGGILKEMKKSGLTVIMVTHDVEFAAENSDRCAMIFDGEIISIDKPHNFFSNNNFYTTAASRISRHMYQNTILCESVVKLCKINEAL